jgi:RNA polymerase sigma factor, sigma-70 family
MISDESLYYRYLDGDDDALAELLSRYDESLNLFLFSFVQNAEDAEELALDAFARLAASDKRFQGRSSFKTWLFAIGRNLALQHLRRHRINAGTLTDEARDEKTPDLPMLSEERYRQLYLAMEKLKAEYRQVLYLKYFEDMTVSETATVLKKSERQVSDLIYRGKQSLKETLEKEGFEYEDGQ